MEGITDKKQIEIFTQFFYASPCDAGLNLITLFLSLIFHLQQFSISNIPKLRPRPLLFFLVASYEEKKTKKSKEKKCGGVRPPSPPRHDTMAPEQPTPSRVQPPRRAKTKDVDFHYTVRTSSRHSMPHPGLTRVDVFAFFYYYELSWPAHV